MLGLLSLVLPLVLGATVQINPRDGYTCDPNDWNGHQWCLCKPGEKIKEIHSTHSDKHEDRIWSLACGVITPEFLIGDESHWYDTTPQNDWDGPVLWNGTADDSFLVGMTSEHSNLHEDRHYKFHTVNSENWYLHDCSWTKPLNDWDADLDYTLGDTQVIAGVESHHSDVHEDRKWTLLVCQLRKKCTEIFDVTYGDVVEDVTTRKVSAAHQEYDNSGHSQTNDFSVTISKTSSNSLTESYSYSQSNGHSTTTSLDVTAGYSFGVPDIDQTTLEVTVGVSSTWDFSETWERSSSRTYSEENGRQMTFTEHCGPGCKCKLDVVVQTASGVIPYVMKSQSVDGIYVCEEEGELTVDYSFDGKGIASDDHEDSSSCKSKLI